MTTSRTVIVDAMKSPFLWFQVFLCLLGWLSGGWIQVTMFVVVSTSIGISLVNVSIASVRIYMNHKRFQSLKDEFDVRLARLKAVPLDNRGEHYEGLTMTLKAMQRCAEFGASVSVNPLETMFNRTVVGSRGCPPSLAQFVFSLGLPPDMRDGALDLATDRFNRDCERHNLLWAVSHYWWDATRSIRPIVIRALTRWLG